MARTRKKILAENATREQVNRRSCRHQKKPTSTTERKVSELITSSAKKQRNVGILPGKNREAQGAKSFNTSYALSEDENEDICLAFQNTLNSEPSEDCADQCVLETIFSPTFHFPKDGCGDIVDKDDFTVLFRGKDQKDCQDYAVEDSKIDSKNLRTSTRIQQNSVKNRKKATSRSSDEKTDSTSRSSKNHGNSSCDEEYRGLGNLSTEVSSIYLAMQNSKLECIDESHESVSTDSCVESDEDDEFDDFDPYLFMKNLPDLSALVPAFRPTLLPKQTRSCPSTTLVLDLDETLVHSTLEPCDDFDFTILVNFNFEDHTVYVRVRPYLKEFMDRVSTLFEIIIFTASQGIYAEQLLNVLDPKRRLFRHRVFRESCVYLEGNYMKDLSILGRDLARVIIIDNSPQTFGFQVDNGIPIESWFNDRTDRELLLLLPFLESLVGVEDVRPVIAKRFNLREKIAAAACLSVDFDM